LAQLIASYRWKDRKLGPANARLSVAKLFQGTAYDNIRRTSEELSYEIFLLSILLERQFRELSKFKYIDRIKDYIYFSTFSIMAKTLTENGLAWDNPELLRYLEAGGADDAKLWRMLAKKCIDHIYAEYKRAERAYRKKTGIALSLNNYFKSPSDIERLMSKKCPGEMGRISKKLVKSIG